jgi:hypothetical protein
MRLLRIVGHNVPRQFSDSSKPPPAAEYILPIRLGFLVYS